LESKECIAEISKKMTKGQIRGIGKPRHDVCDSSPCRSFKVKHNFTCVLKTNQECDSKLAKILNGRLTSKIVRGLVLNGEGSGAHHGKFRIFGSTGTDVKGILGGITNAGTHHASPSDCESCNVKGHIGRKTKKNREWTFDWE
jgi:hypothetical protein